MLLNITKMDIYAFVFLSMNCHVCSNIPQITTKTRLPKEKSEVYQAHNGFPEEIFIGKRWISNV